MKELLLQYASYNAWANKKITEIILTLSPELCSKEIKSSFSSLNKTMLHMLDAESIWWQRLKLNEKIVVPSEDFKGETKDIVSSLLLCDLQWQEWVAGATDVALDHVFQYQNSKKESFKQPVYQVLQHVFNHGTYHRGQLITMLRELGVEKLPATDFILFTRNKK